MKKLISFIIILSFNSTHLKAQEWQIQNLSNFAQVNFPKHPRIIDTLGQKLYQLNNDTIIYLAQINIYDKKSQGEISEDQLDEFYEGIAEGFIKGKKGTLISSKNNIIQGRKVMDLQFSSISKNKIYNLIFSRFIYLDTCILAIHYITTNKWHDLDLNNKTKFFNSLHFKDSVKSKIQPTKTSYNSARRLGYIFGKILLYAIIIALIFAALYFIRKNGS